MIKRVFFISLVVVVAAAGVLLSMATPSSEAVRLRNSLLYEVTDEASLRWTPENYPVDFKRESGPAPDEFRKFAAELENSAGVIPDGLDFGRTAGRKLIAARRSGGAIQQSTVETLDTILNKGIGYCADYTQVINGLAFAAGVPVREWGMSFDGFGGNGHAFNELFDPRLHQWVFVDTFYSFYVVDKDSRRPLSALEFRDRLRAETDWPTVELVALSERGYRFGTELEALQYYRRGVEQFYLWYGNNVFEYDNSLAVHIAGEVSRSLEQVVAVLTGVHPGIRIPRTDTNEEMIGDLARTRALLTGFVALLVISGAVAAGSGLVWLKASRSS